MSVHATAALYAWAALIAATPQAEGPASGEAGPLVVTVTGVRHARGHVRVEVCTRAEFLKSCVLSGAAPAVADVTRVVVAAVPPGVYAIQAYLDENDDHHVDRNAIGVPKEGVGFSNDAAFFLGPPSFRVARFEVGPGGGAVHLRLRYMRG